MTDHGWAQEVDALTLTWVRGLDLPAVLDVMDVDRSTERQVTFDQAWDAVADGAAVYPLQAEELGGWLVLVEPNGWLTADWPAFQELSRGQEAVSLFWNVNAQMRFEVARDGELVRSFDLLFPDDPDSSTVGEPLPEEAGLPFGDVEAPLHAVGLELAERVTGVPIGGAWLLEQPRRTWDAPDHLPDPPAPPPPRRRWFRR